MHGHQRLEKKGKLASQPKLMKLWQNPQPTSEVVRFSEVEEDCQTILLFEKASLIYQDPSGEEGQESSYSSENRFGRKKMPVFLPTLGEGRYHQFAPLLHQSKGFVVSSEVWIFPRFENGSDESLLPY